MIMRGKFLVSKIEPAATSLPSEVTVIGWPENRFDESSTAQ
jgi:hypothetical protein